MSAITETGVTPTNASSTVAAPTPLDPGLVSGVRAALIDRYGILVEPGLFPSNKSFKEMQDTLGRFWDLFHKAKFSASMDVLPDLLRTIPRSEETQDWEYTAEVYQLTSAVMCAIGEIDLAFVAADRAIVASNQFTDVLGMAAGYYRLCHVLLANGKSDGVLETVRFAKILMERASIEDPARVSLRGALELCRAIASARDGQADDAFASIREAYEIAKVVPAGANIYHTEFAHGNVAVHEVAVFVELGMYETAIAAAQNIDDAELSYERYARLCEYVAVARAQMAEIA